MSRVLYTLAMDTFMYVMVNTKLDIAKVVGVVRRFLSKPGRMHWEVIK